MFYPKKNKLVKYRYKSDIDKKICSYLHSNKSPLVFKDLKKYLKFEVTFQLINYDNDEPYQFAQLRICRLRGFQIKNDVVTGIITSDEIKLDFLCIETIKLKELESDNVRTRYDSKRRENCRLLASIKDPAGTVFRIISKILRNKCGNGNLNMISIWKSLNATCPNQVTVSLKNSVPYYPNEVKLIMGNEEFSSITEENRKNQYNHYEFDISRSRLKIKFDHKCRLNCQVFGISSNELKFQIPENSHDGTYANLNTEIGDVVSCNETIESTIRIYDENVPSCSIVSIDFSVIDIDIDDGTYANLNTEIGDVVNCNETIESTIRIYDENAPSCSTVSSSFCNIGANMGDKTTKLVNELTKKSITMSTNRTRRRSYDMVNQYFTCFEEVQHDLILDKNKDEPPRKKILYENGDEATTTSILENNCTTTESGPIVNLQWDSGE